MALLRIDTSMWPCGAVVTVPIGSSVERPTLLVLFGMTTATWRSWAVKVIAGSAEDLGAGACPPARTRSAWSDRVARAGSGSSPESPRERVRCGMTAAM
ncbi:unannotated protein [freshwater metagenome]|uniref:Unannotated protein n=1 Tax=freshwater metagenome TaxID=449393 RepID=A0A6J7G144_9ZZZZ